MKRRGLFVFLGTIAGLAVARAEEQELPNGGADLLAELKDPDPSARRDALLQLGRISFGRKHPHVVAAMVALTRDRDGSVRVAAVSALSRKTDHADIVVPALIQAFSDPREDVPQFAAFGLRNFGSKGKAAIPLLLKLLAHPECPYMRSSGAAGLGGAAAPSASKEVLDALIAALTDADFGVRENAAEALGSVGGGANREVVLAALGRLSSDPCRTVRLAAGLAIGTLLSDPKPEIADPVAIFDGTDPDAKSLLLARLGKPDAPSPDGALLGKILALLRDKDEELAGSAALVVARVGAQAEAAVPALVDLLETRNSHLLACAITGLKAVGPDSAPAIPKLIRLLSSADDSTVSLAAGALGAIGPKSAAAAVPQLVKVLTSPSYQARESAADALGAIGVRSKEVLDALRTAEKDPAERVRIAAKAALEKLAVGEKKS